jgi:hypothetical protein
MNETLERGALKLVPLAEGETAEATLTPLRNVDVGSGPGVKVTRQLRGGVVGLVFDARGRRPLPVPAERTQRVLAAKRWSQALELYPQ